MYKKIFAAFTAAVLCLGISSCGKGGDEQVSETAAETSADGKRIIKMYALRGDDISLKKSITDFNMKNPDYRVELTAYINEYKEEPLTRLNIDITTGNAPDILVVETAVPVKSYIDKGMFADLYEFIDSDPELKREDLLGSVLRAYENDGRLCMLVPQFYIETVMGKTSLVGDRQGMTVSELIELAEKYPDKKLLNGYTTKSSALDLLLRYSYGSFIDSESGKCSFDSDSFTDLLKFCGRFPFEVPEDYYTNEFAFLDEEYELFNGGILFYSNWTIGNFTCIRFFENAVFGEPVTFIGFPGAGGNGAVIKPDAAYAVMEDSENKEGAWEFLRGFYSEEYQDGILSSLSPNFPVRMSSLEIMAENAKKGVYDPLEGKYREPERNLFGKKIGLGLNTDEDNRRMYELLGSAAGTMENDVYIYGIVTDEAAAYFSGQKSAEEAAAIIQNRVQNYLDENK